ncbi:MAG: YdcF family protein [Prosthecobacter sp.]|nr:YdcF family protein [Prosthecobacter sp.]
MPADAPEVDAILCLGGGAEPSLTEPTGTGFNSAADRVTTALALLSAGRAPVLVVAGGDYRDKTQRYSEADAVVAWIQNAVKPPQEIISLGICKDTHDEAMKVAALAQQRGWKSFLLVTSAAHMPRAHATFAKAGLNTQAVPCDYVSSYNRIGSVRWLHLPGHASIHGFDAWLHEVLGMMLYWMRGWI